MEDLGSTAGTTSAASTAGAAGTSSATGAGSATGAAWLKRGAAMLPPLQVRMRDRRTGRKTDA